MRRNRIIIGLNSGTSADGVDAVACEVRGRGLAMGVQVLGRRQRAYPAELRARLLAVMAPAVTRTEEICRLNATIGEEFAAAALGVVRKLGLRRVDLIGSHGQTIGHLPRGGGAGATLQIGEPAVIAARLGMPVVADFRQADVAAGGQGAPLVPWTDYVLFRHPRRSRVIQNIGGIANLTWLPAGGGPDEVLAFDTGPGNMVIDGLVRHFTKGREHFDRGGRRAARGVVQADMLARWLRHSFLLMAPPKSCGREEFGAPWLRRILERTRRKGITADDWIATATAFTAASIAGAYARWLPRAARGRRRVDEVILCGGGAANPVLIRMLTEELAQTFDVRVGEIAMTTMAEHGIDPQAKECVSFAMLAAACMDGVPANLPQVTGARRRVVLGKLCPPGSRR